MKYNVEKIARAHHQFSNTTLVAEVWQNEDKTWEWQLTATDMATEDFTTHGQQKYPNRDDAASKGLYELASGCACLTGS